MLTYKYVARNPANGEKIKAEVQAETVQAASKLLRQQGLAPISIEIKERPQHGLRGLTNRVRTKDKILFSRQLSTLVNAGLPIIQSLQNVQSQTSNEHFKTIISQVMSDVEAGSSFAQALGKHPEIFNRVFVSMVAAGEASGTLDKSLERLANQQEKDADIIAKVRGAMVYPVIVIFVMIGLVGFMVVAVLPQVQTLYADLDGVQMPILTRLLLMVSDFVRGYWWIVLIAAVAGGFMFSRWFRSLSGKTFFDKVKMRIWPVGPLYMKMYMARFARTGATLVASGVPLIQMLEITAEAVSNVHVAKSITRAIEKVKGGKSLSEALIGDPNFLELVPNMLHIGEQSGATEDMLSKVADYYEKEVDNQIKTISTIIEPVMIVIIGVMALGIVAAILLPIYGLVGQNFL